MDKETRKKVMELVAKDLQVDLEDLNKAVSEQAGLYYYYAMKWAKATSKVLARKADLELYEAKKKRELRKQLADNGRKVTEATIEELVLSDEEYKKLLDAYLEAKDEEAFWQVVKESFKQRKDMIESLVNLSMVLGSTKEQIRMSDVDKIREGIREKIRKKVEEAMPEEVTVIENF